MRSITIGQVVYGLAGIGYNLISLALSAPLAPTNPVVGILAMSLYLLGLVPGQLGYRQIHSGVMVAALLIFGYGGIAVHLMAFAANPATPVGYQSTAALLVAVAINATGFALNLFSLLKTK